MPDTNTLTRGVVLGFLSLSVLVFCVLAAVFWIGFVGPILKTIGTRDWVETPCRILSSELARWPGVGRDHPPTYGIRVRYSYEFAGKNYESDRHSLTTRSGSDRSRRQWVVDRLPEGSIQRCFVDPRNPQEAALSREIDSEFLFFAAIPVVLMLLAGASTVFCIHLLRTRFGRLSPCPVPTVGEILTKRSAMTGMASGSNARVWTSGDPQRKQMLCYLFIWSAMMVFVMASVMEKVLQLHLGFVILNRSIVLLLLVLAAYCFVAFSWPKIRITLDPWANSLGGAFTFTWQLRRSFTDEIYRFHVWLEAKEIVSYQRGSYRATDHHVFTTVELANSTRPEPTGHVSANIPADSIHSFRSKHNRIVWSIRLTAEKPDRLVLDETIEFDVLPLPTQ